MAMFRRRLSEGMNPRMSAIMGAFSDLVDLLRPAHCFATRDHLECYCSIHQFSHAYFLHKEKSFAAAESKSSL
jgi:hypothetical protein